MKIFSRIYIIVLMALGCVVILIGCGGGSSGPAAPVLLASTSQTLGAAGGTISTPVQNVALTVAPNSLASDTTVILNVYDQNGVTIANPNLPARSNTANIAGIDNLSPDGMITITMPYNGEIDTENDFVVLADSSGHLLSKTPTFDAGHSTFSYTVTADDINILNAMSGRATRSLGNIFGNLRHVYLTPVQPYVSINLFKDGINNLPSNSDWNCWDAKTVESDWSRKRIALVIHGINNDLRNMNALAYYLKKLNGSDGNPFYHAVYGVDYKFAASIGNNAELLADFLIAHHADQVEIYGHSMGGLIARWAIEKAGAQNCVKRLFTFGTPHNGVPGRGLATAAVTSITGITGLMFFDITCPGINDLIAGGSFLRQLDDNSTHTGTDYYTFAGNYWQDYSFTLKDGTTINVGKMMHDIYSGNDKNMDGIVPVNSAKYAGLSNKCSNWINPSQCYAMNHGRLRGEEAGSSFTLDTDTGHPSLRDFILNTGGIITTIE